MLIDCHSHKGAPYREGIVSGDPFTVLMPGQYYSLGVHPWYVPDDLADALAALRRACTDERVLAVGECGLDRVCATPWWLQLSCFKAQAELAEESGKPLVVHCVRAAGEVARLRRAMGARVPWVVHGFRGKPSVCELLLGCGCFLSFGERFNAESLAMTPVERLLAETDESRLSIEEIVRGLSVSRGVDLTGDLERNMKFVFNVTKL